MYKDQTALGACQTVPARSTLLVGISSRIAEINERVSLANQKIEGVMRRAGLPIPPSQSAGCAGAQIQNESSDITIVEAGIATGYSQVAELENLADALSYLA